MVIGPPVSQQTPDGEHHDAEDHQQRRKMSATQECPTLAIRSDPRYAFASALRARSRRISFSISSMRSSCALTSRSRSIRPARIARFAAARLELGGVSSGNETNPRSQHVLERLPQRTLLRARTLIKFTADHLTNGKGKTTPVADFSQAVTG